jgi:hypothetical protein
VPITDATIAELIGRVISDFSDLVDRQIELAKQELHEDLGEVLGAVKKLALGSGIALGAGVLAIIWLWTAFIWFFNWVGESLLGPYIGVFGGLLGWLLSLAVMGAMGWFAYRFVRRGISEIQITPMDRTRATFKENLEWVRQLGTLNKK